MVTTPSQPRPIKAVRRAWWIYACAVLVVGIFGVRAFYLQVIRHDHYVKAAMESQLKEYEIPATRGTISAYEGDRIVPLVLNEKHYTLFGDPQLVKDTEAAAKTVAQNIGGKWQDYQDLLETPESRYVILGRKVTEEQRDAILEHKYPGIAAQQQYYRTYPNGSLAAQILGFVNNDDQGVYGVEQALDGELQGTAGLLKAITDVNGVPLPANKENTRLEPKDGDDVVLTIDMAMQSRLEQTLKAGLERAKSDSGNALIMDPNTGAIKAMANWPTYNPGDYSKVEDSSVFNNAAVSSPLEVGSIMKPLTAAAALDLGKVNPNSSYYDPAEWSIDGYKITNIEEDGGAAQQNVQSILRLSLNTGATWLLMQMSDQADKITETGRERWYEYMTEHYMLGKTTGVEQGYEAEGYIPDPNEGYGLDLAYANTSFGQAMTATPLQMAAAYSSIINGGVYYQPRLVDKTVNAAGEETVEQPIVVRDDVVSPQVSQAMRQLLEGVVVDRASIAKPFNHGLYSIGGKTGTAEIANPDGGYYTDQFNGTYAGFVGGDNPEYVIVVRVNKPKIWGYAGSQAAQPIFVDLAHMLLDDFGVTPRSQ
jgi:cell division protein FtsI (penicillin-binding protein 3)